MAACASTLLSVSTRASVVLPGAAARVQFGGIAAFDTDGDPPIIVTNGAILSGGVVGSDVDVTAIGRVTIIHEANNVDNAGTISVGGELSMLFTITITATSATEIPNNDPNERTYVLASNISSASMKLWDDPSQDLNIGSLVGTPIGNPPNIPGEATDGELFLDATLGPGSGTALLQVTYGRPDANSDFDTVTADLQVLTVGGFDIVGGALLDAFPDATGESINARQIGPGVPALFPTIDLGGGLAINGPVDRLVESTFDIVIIVPEPGSALLLVMGGVLMMRAGFEMRDRRGGLCPAASDSNKACHVPVKSSASI